MADNNHSAPSLGRLLGRTLGTGLGALGNRGELLIVELQEERLRVVKVIILGVAGLFLGMMTILLLTGMIIFLVPPEFRVYVAGGFAFLYFAGSIAAFLILRSQLKHAPFAESLAQFKKDRELLEAFE
jgi:uncharacterized membrane protein YqjE